MKSVGTYIGDYRILALQQETSSTELYVVEHTSTPGDPLALQLWPGVRLHSGNDYSAFLSRSKALIDLQDPALLAVKDGDVEGDNPYLVLGYEAISSELLSQRLARRASEPFPAWRGREFLTQVGLALVAAHARGIVHGQISPESVLLAPDDRVLLTKFSLPFMAPEAGASKLDDQAALARLATELLNEQDATQTPAVAEALARAMQNDPAQRFATVREFLCALGIGVPGDESPLERAEDSEQQLQSDSFAATAGPSQAYAGPGGTTASSQPQWTPPQPPPSARSVLSSRGSRIALMVVGALLALVLLVFGGNWLYSVLPAMSATVTIVPIRQTVQQNYTFTLGQTNDFTQKQVASRVIKYTTSTQSESVKSSVAHGHIDATQAQGKVTISSGTGTVPAGPTRIPSNSGVKVIVFVTNSISSGSQTFSAMAENAGSGGNIPAYDINGSYYLVSNPNVTLYAQNTSAFTGGMDAYDGPIVQQQDIDQGQSDLTAKLQQEAQQKITAQLQPGEALLTVVGGGTVDCTPQAHADHKDGDPAAAVTVTEHMDCQAMAYDAPATLTWVQNDLQQQVQKTMGAHFGRVGELQVTTSLLLLPDTPPTSFQYLAQGEWVLQLDAGGQQAVARGIEGLSQVQARAILLRTFHAKTKSLVLSILWGQHLPIDISGIKIIGLASLPPGS
jgi:hypothetical protein